MRKLKDKSHGKTYIVIVVSILVAVICGWAGYFLATKGNRFHDYDYILSDLGDQVFIFDAATIQDTNQIKQLSAAKIESDFFRIVQLQNKHGFSEFEDMRCAITKKVRALKEQRLIFKDKKTSEDSGIDVASVEDYLKTNCLGKPSRANWAEIKESKPSNASKE